MREIDESIPIDGYRLRSLKDNDDGFNYELVPTQHAEGMYEIELVLEKIKRPEYGSRLSWQKIVELTTSRAVAVIEEMLKCEDENKIADLEILDAILSQSVLPNYILIRSHLPDVREVRLKALLSKYISTVPFDAAWYLQKYPDLARSGAQTLDSALSHFVRHGYFEGRQGSAAYSELGLRK